jgi:hypothetical protein
VFPLSPEYRIQETRVNSMSHRQSEIDSNQAGAFEVLDLELCPDPVQVMPPVNETRALPMVLLVFGNLLVGSFLLAGLLLLPAFIASLAPWY